MRERTWRCDFCEIWPFQNVFELIPCTIENFIEQAFNLFPFWKVGKLHSFFMAIEKNFWRLVEIGRKKIEILIEIWCILLHVKNIWRIMKVWKTCFSTQIPNKSFGIEPLLNWIWFSPSKLRKTLGGQGDLEMEGRFLIKNRPYYFRSRIAQEGWIHWIYF